MILVDTSVLGRLASFQSSLHRVAMKAVRMLVDRGEVLMVSSQSIYEFWVVATRPLDVNGFGWSTSRTIDWVYYFEYSFRVIPDTAAAYPEWRGLVQHYETRGKPAHDARLVAFMNVYGIASILTLNGGDFERYGVTILDPRTMV